MVRAAHTPVLPMSGPVRRRQRRRMRIAIDARELHGKPTGVGRFLGELLAAWKTMPEGQGHEFVLLAPEGATSDGGTLWEQMVLPTLARDAGAGVLFAPAYSGPVLPPVPMVLAIHDVSFAAHPEWFAWREGAAAAASVQLAARAATRVITISQFSKREIVAHLGIDAEKIHGRVSGCRGPVSEPTARRDMPAEVARPPGALFSIVGSIFNRRHVPELIDGFARLARIHPELRLEIVGDNRTSPHVDLEAITRSTVLGDRVHIRSYVPDDQLRALYGNSAAFVFLSEIRGIRPDAARGARVGTAGAAARHAGRAGNLRRRGAIRRSSRSRPHRTRTRRCSSMPQSVNGFWMKASVMLARYSWTDCARRVLEVLVGSGISGPTGFAAR